ncbi:MAG: HdeA family protein [Chromatiaceae bacterium]|jgi:hypothetical protein|nr:HdeA family protein [Chromatiaceae bacterium]
MAAAALAVFALNATDTAAAEPTGTKQDLGTFSCKEVMRLSGEDRGIALALAHGYVLGKKGTTQYEIEALAQITDQFIDHCLDHPTDNALQSFETIAK